MALIIPANKNNDNNGVITISISDCWTTLDNDEDDADDADDVLSVSFIDTLSVFISSSLLLSLGLEIFVIVVDFAR